MNIIELREDEISVVSGGRGYVPHILGFFGGEIGIGAAVFIGVAAYVLMLDSKHNFVGKFKGAFARPRVFCAGAAAITVVFLVANVGGAAIGWIISRPLVWTGLVADK